MLPIRWLIRCAAWWLLATQSHRDVTALSWWIYIGGYSALGIVGREAVTPSALTSFFHRKFAAYFYSGLSNFGYICSNALSQVHAIVLGTASVSLSDIKLSIMNTILISLI